MNTLISRCSHITTTAILTLWCCLAQSDDTEVYVGAASGITPIAVMAIDTSGSMGYWTEASDPEYDPTVTYKDLYKEDPNGNPINYPFSNDHYYFSSEYEGGTITQPDFYDLESRSFQKSALACKNAEAGIQKYGTVSDLFKRWNTTTKMWEPTINGVAPGGNDGTPGDDCSSSNTPDKFTSTFGNFKNWNKFFEHFNYNFQNFRGQFINYIFDLKTSLGDAQFSDVDDDFEDKFKTTLSNLMNNFYVHFTDDINGYEEGQRGFISNNRTFKSVFGDYSNFQSFFQNIESGNSGGSCSTEDGGVGANITIPNGSDTDVNALVDCYSDEAGENITEYVNTNPTDPTQYLSTPHSATRSQSWEYNFKNIYDGNFLNFLIYADHYNGSRKVDRMQVTKEAAKFVVGTTNNIKLGLARFGIDNAGGMIDIAVNQVEDIRDEFNTTIDKYLPWGGTPLTETFYETALYLRGDTIDYGNSTAIRLQKSNTTLSRESSGFIDQSDNWNKTYEQSHPSDSRSKDGNKYKSPIISSCQGTSNIVLFTDGAPSSDSGANSEIQQLLKAAKIDFSIEPGLTNEDRKVLTNDCSGSGGCAEELAYLLANTDQSPLHGMQTINTHVIGGFFDENSSQTDLKRMENIAKYGKGTFAVASSQKDIVKAFKGAVTAVFDKPVTFVAPAVSVNSYNSLEHLDNLYYAMFVPSANNNWQGNLKSYRLSPDGLVVDANGDAAIDYSSGLFKEKSRSYWTPDGITDGSDVSKGGAAGRLQKEHNIFTHLTDTAGPLNTRLSTSNISKDRLGLTADASGGYHSAVIDWLNRKNSEGGNRNQMEDPLHSRPVVVNYGYDVDETTHEVTSNGVVFVGSNSGYLHAFKADKHEFKEYFSFIPKELLKNADLYRSADKMQTKAYGVDGPINYWHVDANQNLQVDDGEKVYLFFGLRRGGRHYYALDITNPEEPKFQWQISGGNGGDFDKLGQTWSPMTLAKVRWGDAGKTKVVLLFGGGYDPEEDNNIARTSHSMGNSVYMIDPATGKLLWSASNSDAATNLTNMTSAITSGVKAVDYDGDQITDYFFVSDLGGRIWRFDLNAKTENIGKSNFIADSGNGAGMIFDANKNSTNYQRFYYAPSVSYFKNYKTNEQFLTLSIGSGFRASPLKTGMTDTQDSFYIIKDSNITSPPKDYKYITLTRANFTDIPEDSQLSTSVLTKGWKYDLRSGEKVLSTPLTTNGNMYFTTFSPRLAVPNPDGCNADIGYSLAYAVDFMGDDDPHSDPVSPSISSQTMPNIGIPPQVIELNTTDTGQKAFCKSNPSHASCQPPACEETGTCPDECESTGSVILSGTHVIGGGMLRCDLIKKNYWRSL